MNICTSIKEIDRRREYISMCRNIIIVVALAVIKLMVGRDRKLIEVRDKATFMISKLEIKL